MTENEQEIAFRAAMAVAENLKAVIAEAEGLLPGKPKEFVSQLVGMSALGMVVAVLQSSGVTKLDVIRAIVNLPENGSP